MLSFVSADGIEFWFCPLRVSSLHIVLSLFHLFPCRPILCSSHADIVYTYAIMISEGQHLKFYLYSFNGLFYILRYLMY